jgi:hypothetical protein
MGNDGNLQRWMDVVSAFNNGDAGPLSALFDEACSWPNVGTGRDQIMARINELIGQGWNRHEVLSVAGTGALVTSLARNTMTNGTTWVVAGTIRFGDNGKVVELFSLNDPPFT